MNNDSRPSTEDWQAALREFDRAVRNVVGTYYGDDGFETRPVFEGAQSTMLYAKPRQGLRAAMMLRNLANGSMGDFVRQCRADGVTWDELAKDLGVDGAEAAYLFVAPDWSCKVCRGLVHDQGPYDAHPANSEPGHADDCARLVAAVGQHRRERYDE
jgi:hypothetical protein